MTGRLTASVVAPEPSVADALQGKLDRLTKPRGSLGRLEEMARWYGAARGTTTPVLRRKAIIVFAGDHGVTSEGVSAYPAEVTAQMVYNFLRGGAGINVLGRHVGAEVVVVDVGVAHVFPELDGLRRCKVRPGTANLAREPAMTREETEAAMAGKRLGSNLESLVRRMASAKDSRFDPSGALNSLTPIPLGSGLSIIFTL